jgi:hypothetical protein
MATLVNSGLEKKAKLLNGVSTTPIKWIAIGIGTAAEANDQTALDSEITTGGGARALATLSYEADYKAKWEHTFTFTSTFDVIELGLFDQLSIGGNMLMRHKFSVARHVESTDTLEIAIRETESRV